MSSNAATIYETKTRQSVALEAYAEKVLLRSSATRDRVVAGSQQAGLPEITVQPLAGQFLAVQCRLIGAREVLELGTLGGYSAAWFAEAGGVHVTSVEANPQRRDVATRNLGPLVEEGKVEIILGNALDVLPRLHAEGRRFDLVLIDADWDNQYNFFNWAVKMTRPRGCIYVDNAVRTVSSKMDAGQTWDDDASLFARIGRDERVTATLVPTITGNKARTGEMFDGFIMAIVN